MKQLVNALFQGIVKQINPHRSNIVRIEGIDNPFVYQEICKIIMGLDSVDIFIPKMTREKFIEFSESGKAEWSHPLAYLHKGTNGFYSQEISDEYAEKSFVDFNNAITKWRNESSNFNNNITALILLMGTEAAQDTGGLADTSFVISPKEIISSLSRDYSVWFKHVIENNDIHEEYQKAIHTLYRALFSQISTDIFALSSFIDSLDELQFSSVQELIGHICETLNDTWGIPSIVDKKAIPRVSALNKGTLSSAKILISAAKFIDRVDDIPTNSALNKLHQKFEKYALDNEIDPSLPFPEENPLFSDYQEFKKTVIEFMQGIDLELNRQKLLQVDFAIVNSIVGTKLPKTPKEKTPIYSGMPVEAYSRMFLDTFRVFYQSYGMYPTKIQLRLDRVSMSDCTDDQKAQSYMNVCNFVGGILRFFNELTIDIDGEILEFEYESDDGKDPFEFSNYETVSTKIKSTGKWGDPCKIQFGITASNSEKYHKYEYKWAFSPYSSWLNAFNYLSDVFYSKGVAYVLPTMVHCQNIQDYLECESEDEFFSHLQQLRGQSLYDEHKAIIRQYFTSPITGLFDLVCNDFKQFTIKLTQNGYFNANKELRDLVKAYTELLQAVYVNYSSFTDIQKEKLELIVNIFTITSNPYVMDNGEMGCVIVPAYNPIMLEKIDAQQLFLRRGFKELLLNVVSGGYTGSVLKSKFENLIQLSAITQASDVIRKRTNEYLICNNIWEYFGVYYEKNTATNILSSGSVGLSIITDDEDATTMLQKTPMSNIIVRNALDYVRTFPARIDGLNITFIAPTDMQHIVSAIHAIAKKLEDSECPATINVKIICVNSKKNSATYLRRWLDSYFSDEKAVKVNTYLHNSVVNTKSDVEGFRELLKNQDLCFNYNILKSRDVQFDVSLNEEIDINYEKFPMTFTPDTLSATHGKARRINISQFQFYAAKQHTQTSYKLGNPYSKEGTYRAYMKLELPEIQEAVIDIAHSCCRWVLCIDSAIDRCMLETDSSKIIGFTTGEGSYGELNVTVSARKDVLTDIKRMLQRRITEKFTNWDSVRLKKATEYCVDELSQYMDGSRILKALNPYDYEIHSFLAYILTMQMLGLTKQNDDYIMRSLISLDSYKHWFNEDEELNRDSIRPDFMLLEIPYTQCNVEQREKLKISAKIIECKMGYQNEDQIAKAKIQIEKGLRTMALNWRPDAVGVMQRYWFNQLYRAIIFSPLNMDNTSQEYMIVRDKIYGILNGEYEIEWSGDIFAFWLDVNEEVSDEYEIHSIIHDEFSQKRISLGKILCHNFGQLFIQKMLLPEGERTSSFTYNTIVLPEVEEESDDELIDNHDRNGSEIQIDNKYSLNPESSSSEQSDFETPVSGATIPKTSDIYVPFIRYLSDEQDHSRKESLQWYSNFFSVAEADKKLVYESNGHSKYETAFDSAITDFRKNSLIENSAVGTFHITELGKNVERLLDAGENTLRFFDIISKAQQHMKDHQVPLINELKIQKVGITDLNVDCIVNAANNQLVAGGGVCGVIFKEAGHHELQAACNAIGYCATGEAVITSGYKLKCKYIIHAVGPRWNGGYSNEAEQLSNCYKKALQIAVENECHSIAFPVISSGIFGYPKNQAWDIAIESIYDFFAKHEKYGLTVIISVIDEEAYDLGIARLEEYSRKKSTLDDVEWNPESASTVEEKTEEISVENTFINQGDLQLEDIRVLIGRDKRNLPVYWEFGHPKLANRHILITGTSGQGKTYAIQAMILELARQNISSVVFDYTDGFLPGKLEPEFESELGDRISQEVAILNRIPVNPFRLQMIEIPPFGSVPEKSTTVAGRIADILKHVYALGDQQSASIYAACKQGVDQYGENMDFAKLRLLLEQLGTSHSKSVLSKMAQFFDMDLFDSSKEFNWKDVTHGNGTVTVIQLTGLDRELQTVVTEIMMWDAWYSLTKFGDKNTPFVVVLDEAQNLSFKEKSPAEKILREGRKYGWSAWFATQFLKGALDSGEISNLQQAAERLYFKPTGEEMNYIAEQISNNKTETPGWVNVIKGIQKGQCVVQGDRLNAQGQFGAAKPSLISVSSFAERHIE